MHFIATVPVSLVTETYGGVTPYREFFRIINGVDHRDRPGRRAISLVGKTEGEGATIVEYEALKGRDIATTSTVASVSIGPRIQAFILGHGKAVAMLPSLLSSKIRTHFLNSLRERRDMRVKMPPINLDLISAALHHGCMGVPQELVDDIMNTLCDDISALKACSLTCRAMFASARPVIHRTLRLSLRNNGIALIEDSRKKTFCKPGHHVLRFLSYMGEQGILRYTREIEVGNPGTFTPGNLRPHLHHFQSLDRVYSLTIYGYDATKWANHYNTYFDNLYPTLTSLSLHFPVGHYRLLLQFILQFPNLENLCLELLQNEELIPPNMDVPTIADQIAPLSGHLRLGGTVTNGASRWLTEFANKLPNGVHFRSIELEHFSGQHAQHMVNACGRTLENLIIVPSGNGFVPELWSLNLAAATVLRRLTFRTKYPEVFLHDNETFLRAFFTIKSPLFREFAIELERCSVYPTSRSPTWGDWSRLDSYLDRLFSRREGCRLIVRVHQRFDWEAVKRGAMESFPRLVERGCLHLVTFDSIQRF